MFIPVPAVSISKLFTGTTQEAAPFTNKTLKVIKMQPFFISLAKNKMGVLQVQYLYQGPLSGQ